MNNALSRKFTFFSLLKFTLPTIIMMMFMSLYTMVDGIFVSRFVGTTALSAVNIVFPILSIVIAIAIMFATGSSAIIAKKMGENRIQEARENFTLIVVLGIVIGIFILLIGTIFLKPIIRLLGANERVFDYCRDYASILVLFTPLSILQMLFQYFFVTAGKPNIGLIVTIFGGIANIILDYVFMVPLQMGIAGAALATGIGFSIPAIYGLLYFTCNRKGTLFFIKPKLDMKVVIESCFNGSSEMVTNLAVAVTTFLFNVIMMKYLGEDGVAAITIVLYAQYLLTAVYLGYASGIAPVISFNYGTKNEGQLKQLFKISMFFLCATSVITYAVSMILSTSIVTIFTEVGSKVFEIAKNGFGLFAISYLFMGFNIFASAMFTAFSNGKVSAIISFLRTFVFIVIAILVLPQFLGVNGVWLSVVLAELITIVIAGMYVIKLKDVYHYI